MKTLVLAIITFMLAQLSYALLIVGKTKLHTHIYGDLLEVSFSIVFSCLTSLLLFYIGISQKLKLVWSYFVLVSCFELLFLLNQKNVSDQIALLRGSKIETLLGMNDYFIPMVFYLFTLIFLIWPSSRRRFYGHH